MYARYAIKEFSRQIFLNPLSETVNTVYKLKMRCSDGFLLSNNKAQYIFEDEDNLYTVNEIKIGECIVYIKTFPHEYPEGKAIDEIYEKNEKNTMKN